MNRRSQRIDLVTLPRLLTVVAASLCLSLPFEAIAQDYSDVFLSGGLQRQHDHASPLPFEQISMASGNVSLSFTDLALPGNAGRTLTFERRFDGKDVQWSFGLGGMVMWVYDDWWTDQQDDDPGVALHTVEGMSKALTPLYSDSRRIMMTDRFWKYDRETRTLWRPDGSTSSFDTTGRLTEVVDAFGNRVTLAWGENDLEVQQHLGNGQVRQIGVHYATPPAVATAVPTTVSYLGRTWTYAGGQFITSVTPPPGTGPGWTYEYNGLGGPPQPPHHAERRDRRIHVRSAFGGTSECKSCRTGQVNAKSPVCRRTSGAFQPGTKTGTWPSRRRLDASGPRRLRMATTSTSTAPRQA